MDGVFSFEIFDGQRQHKGVGGKSKTRNWIRNLIKE
jgi:hypothetical protein